MGLRARVAAALELPGEVAGGQETILHAREEIRVNRCRRIAGYSTTRIELILQDGTMCIEGEKLTVMRYFNGEIVVRGRIVQLLLGEKSEGGTVK